MFKIQYELKPDVWVDSSDFTARYKYRYEAEEIARAVSRIELSGTEVLIAIPIRRHCSTAPTARLNRRKNQSVRLYSCVRNLFLICPRVRI